MMTNTTTKNQVEHAAQFSSCRQCGYSLEGATTINLLCDECDDSNNNPFSVDPDLAALDAEISN